MANFVYKNVTAIGTAQVLENGDLVQTCMVDTAIEGIVLENKEGDIKYPKFVSGRQNSMLMDDERLWVQFDFTQDRDFLKSGQFKLKILGFQNEMDFAFKTFNQSMIRFASK